MRREVGRGSEGRGTGRRPPEMKICSGQMSLTLRGILTGGSWQLTPHQHSQPPLGQEGTMVSHSGNGKDSERHALSHETKKRVLGGREGGGGGKGGRGDGPGRDGEGFPRGTPGERAARWARVRVCVRVCVCGRGDGGGWAGHGRTGHGRTGHGRAGQGSAGPGRRWCRRPHRLYLPWRGRRLSPLLCPSRSPSPVPASAECQSWGLPCLFVRSSALPMSWGAEEEGEERGGRGGGGDWGLGDGSSSASLIAAELRSSSSGCEREPPGRFPLPRPAGSPCGGSARSLASRRGR